MSSYNYARRQSRVVPIGNVEIGGANPIALQSMTNTSTNDIDGSVEQCIRIANAGGNIVRLTAQGTREAGNIGVIRGELRKRGCNVPLVADVHFNPRAAFAAAEAGVDKVRINPGNFVDPGRTFRKLEYTDEEYAMELKRIEDALVPFLDTCRSHGTTIRIGVNHGSLSDRIMSRYGDTPAGMVESAMEFLRVAVKHDFFNIVISIKASNVVIMVETVRRLVIAMAAEGMDFPLHLGVTEAGDGEDGRIKSAVGIGTLLAEGIGDTIRVSLSEPPENEIPVAKALVDYITSFAVDTKASWTGITTPAPTRRASVEINGIGGTRPTAVISPKEVAELPDGVLLINGEGANPAAHILAEAARLTAEGSNAPIVACITYNGIAKDDVKLRAAADFGRLLLEGLQDGIKICSDAMNDDELYALALNILQATRLRFSHTEYIACPGCGRTLFDLQSTLKAVREATGHLKNLKIGVMGCIVNGPGEMADADYGYVGAAAGHVSLYRGKECIKKNIPQTEAIPALITFLKEEGVWQEP
jgi:(E)-4-hydroxy-3-methylbut-2-enyl-diphosphate synthase